MNDKICFVCGRGNGKSFKRASDLAQEIWGKYPNQSVCVISIDDFEKALKRKAQSFSKWLSQTVYFFDFEKFEWFKRVSPYSVRQVEFEEIWEYYERDELWKEYEKGDKNEQTTGEEN